MNSLPSDPGTCHDQVKEVKRVYYNKGGRFVTNLFIRDAVGMEIICKMILIA